MDLTRKYLVDLAERTVATYLEVFFGLLLADVNNLTNFGLLKSAAIAAIPAGLAVVKGALSKFVGREDSASAVPNV